jgi:hypothetical protein
MRLRKILLWMAPVLAGVLLWGCASTPGLMATPAKFPFLDHPAGRQGIEWTSFAGPDFDVFYGRPKHRPGAGFGFYMGGHPNPPRPEGEMVTQGRLGVFPVVWKATSSETSPKIRRDAFINYKTTSSNAGGKERRYTEQIHIWVYGNTQEDVEALTEYASGLKLFEAKPADEEIK